ncbi:serine/threonine protein kinase [Synechococcus sp. PCC 7502]|uniref:serine/threonine-protein kinase n=1 Tax=Synechococcus sp. PCC 7502 TaxID=1173263 RepID=UPI00029FFC5F|nr:serine/threonine-protein kinase [Synechococcus sp. PCC 7502]AFY74324.1 serine/threonine protein kinase [Synechococcus sp. PCC 7502]
MSYCVNPNCTRPDNPDKATVCLACGAALKLKGSFSAIRPLGRGGFGATYLAVDESLPGHPPCVIKQLRPNTQSASVLKMARELFEREATTLGRIGNHPQIPRLLAYFEEAANFYLVQEYVEGETLKQEFERKGNFKEIDIIKVLSEILPALGFMHQNGVIHRDIKPANIIRRKQDAQLVLIDFGAVSTQTNRATAEEEEGGLLTSFAIGTPGFAPPEQMAMRPVYSSDIYATAMTCLYLMTGRSPKDFPHDPYTGEINWRSEVNLSENMAAIFNKMLQISVSQRFRTAEEVIAAMGAKSAPTITASRPPASNPVTPKRSTTSLRTSTTRGGSTQGAGKFSTQDLSGGSTTGKAITPRTQSTRGWTKSPTGEDDSFTRTRDQTYIGKELGKELKGGRKVIVEYGHGKRNFANLDLSKASLAGTNLSGIVMSRSKLVETDFCQSDLTHASFTGAIMTQVKLNGANLAQAKMQRAILTKADLGGACLNQADLREANLQSAYMSKADLSGADLTGANLKGAYLSQANLRGTNLSGADLKGARITDEQIATAKTNWATVRPDGSKKIF